MATLEEFELPLVEIPFPRVLGASELHGGIGTRNCKNEPLPSCLDYETLRNEILTNPKSVCADSVEKPANMDARQFMTSYQEITASLATLSPTIAALQTKIENLNRARQKEEEAMTNLFKLMGEKVMLEELTNLKDAYAAGKSPLSTKIQSLLEEYQKELTQYEEERTKLLSWKSELMGPLSIAIQETFGKSELEQLCGGKLCAICTENEINRVLDCGHVVCSTCIVNLQNKCHMCRKKFMRPHALYLTTALTAESPIPVMEINPYTPSGLLMMDTIHG